MLARVKWLCIIVFLLGMMAANAQSISDAHTQEVIRQYFSERLQTPDSALKVTFKRLPDLSRFAGQPIQLQCYSQSRRLKLGFQTVWLNVLHNNRIIVKFPVPVDVQIKRTVVVATTNIPFRSPVQAGMLKKEERWIADTELFEQGLSDVRQITGLETTHFIPAGKFLVRRDVQQRNVIRPGDPVEIWVPAGNLVVTAKGIARSAGKIGEYIYVKDTTTGKRIKARVESSKVVIVANERSL